MLFKGIHRLINMAKLWRSGNVHDSHSDSLVK
jgi:hypothetical protein